MSRTPEEAEDRDRFADYTSTFRDVFRMHERGKSFSGRERNCVFLNTGGSTSESEPLFTDISSASGLDFADDGRGLVWIDWDRDGDLDLWASNRTAPRLRFLRNGSGPGQESLALRLIGRTVNRDALGARVELLSQAENGESLRQVATVRAGQGFLSQSSRWLHFGLGERQPRELRILWPDGQVQILGPLQPGQRHEITQACRPKEEGCEDAPPRTEDSGPRISGGEALEILRDQTPERVFLASRVPMPEVGFRDLGGLDSKPAQTATGEGQPLLVNLWASWCLPCAGELRELSADWQDLYRDGLRILALSVDGLDGGAASTVEDARRFLERNPVPFATGQAEADTLDRLQILLDRLFSKQIPLAVPTSFLLDRQGRLAALYRGPVTVSTLREDMGALGLEEEARRGRLVPFAGRWFEKPQSLRLTTIAQRFLDEGYPRDALHFLQAALVLRPQEPELLTSLGNLLQSEGQVDEAREAYVQALVIDPSQSSAAKNLGDLAMAAGQPRNAATYYRQAITAAPELVEARFNLANTLQALGDPVGAMQEYRSAIERNPRFAGAHNNLGALLLQKGLLGEAAEHLERALAIDASLADAHVNLGILALNGKAHSKAIDHLERAVELRPSSPEAHNNLGVALLRAGQAARAIQSFESALVLRPGYRDAKENLLAAQASQ